MNTKLQHILSTTMLLLACAIFTWRFWPQSQASPHCAMHETKMAQQQGQDGEEGNPGHKEPAQLCATNPTGKQVGCKCAKHRTCKSDGTTDEPVQCRAWCFKNWCMCQHPPCP